MENRKRQYRRVKPFNEMHGAMRTAEYKIWVGVIQRCTNPRADAFKNYGGRGITICDEWRNSFPAFLAHIGPRPTPKHTLDRIDSNMNYEPGNVRWAVKLVQANNTRRNHVVEAFGVKKTIAEWARSVGINSVTLTDRLTLGMVPEVALSKPVRSAGGRTWNRT